jgi:hypothetical protein
MTNNTRDRVVQQWISQRAANNRVDDAANRARDQRLANDARIRADARAALAQKIQGAKK